MTSRRRSQDILVNIPLLLRLVWQATPLYLLLSLAIQGFQSLIPALMLLIDKAIVDMVIANWGNANFVWRPLVILVAMRFGVSLTRAVFNQTGLYVSQIFTDRLNLHTKFVLLEKSAQLDLSHFESPEFYDTLERAQNSGSNYPVRVIQTLTGLFGQGITLISLLGLLLQFNIAIVGPLPLFYGATFFLDEHYLFWAQVLDDPYGKRKAGVYRTIFNGC